MSENTSKQMQAESPNKENLIAAYMQQVLESESFPTSVYAFCAKHNWQESQFYANYGSLKALRRDIWNVFLQQTLERCNHSSTPHESLREKSLNFYFTFFELLSLNRSYVLLDLHQAGNPLPRLDRIEGMKSGLNAMAKSWFAAVPQSSFGKLQEAKPYVYAAGMWGQLLFLMDFWIKDPSSDFEKTDMAIEKSVNTIFDLVDSAPLERLIDFGKFLVRERFS
ncbi:MAG: hypothetical protein RLZZ241_379 [Bacteroidota bacterium]|jgi:hypothetical protein